MENVIRPSWLLRNHILLGHGKLEMSTTKINLFVDTLDIQTPDEEV